MIATIIHQGRLEISPADADIYIIIEYSYCIIGMIVYTSSCFQPFNQDAAVIEISPLPVNYEYDTTQQRNSSKSQQINHHQRRLTENNLEGKVEVQPYRSVIWSG